jgi:hypothetical protein
MKALHMLNQIFGGKVRALAPAIVTYQIANGDLHTLNHVYSMSDLQDLIAHQGTITSPLFMNNKPSIGSSPVGTLYITVDWEHQTYNVYRLITE